MERADIEVRNVGARPRAGESSPVSATTSASTIMRLLLPRLLLFLSLLLGGTALAQTTVRIAAVVNDEVITVFDLQSRLDLILASIQPRNVTEAQRRLAPQVLRQLIDEKLQLQEAKRLKITVTDKDIEASIARLERQNGLPKGGIDAFLKRFGVPRSALVEQRRAEVAWTKLVRKRLRSNVQVGDEEVDEILSEIKANEGKPEHLVAEIFLAVDDPKQDRNVQIVINRLYQQLVRGSDFRSLARNFSQSASAAVGGDLGWVRQGQLDPELDTALSKMEPGQISRPIRTAAGYHILFLRKTRPSPGLTTGNERVTLQQVFLPLAKTATENEAKDQIERARKITRSVKTCDDMDKLGRQLGTPLSGSLGTVKTTKLPAAVRNVIRGLPVNKASAPMRTNDGVIVLMVCKREGTTNEAAIRDRIRRRLFGQRLDILARQYLRDLRRSAFIDVRL